MGGKLNREGQRIVRSRKAVGAVLLVLALHAFVASATHFHASFAPANGASQAVLESRDDAGQRTTPSSDANCLLCRLQRDFVGGVQPAAPALAPPPTITVEHESVREAPVRTTRLLMRAGRAPPLA
ncbi:MAG TPA: hypothetical protein VJ866_10690 [Pyrinomonadaceae bacterium]|nr:hypothetical protein [Pyrinomonadaceae bacterium]